MILFRFLLLAVALLALEGCSLFGDDYSDLEPGTFRFRANGRTYTGTARYYPNTDTPLAEAQVSLMSVSGDFVIIVSDDFLVARTGDRFEPLAYFGYSYQSEDGELEIQSVDDENIVGRFRFQMGEVGNGPVQGNDVTIDGGFYSTLDDE